MSLAMPPVTLEEWRRIASGYTLASGTVVAQSDPTALSYAETLTHLQQALATGRLELLSMGYSDPNLADLSINRMSFDAGAQYDAGYSALFASLEAAPSHGTAPAGGTIPKAMQRGLVARHLTYAFADGESSKIAKRTGVASGAYRSAESSLTELVVDARASRGLESADASAALADTFDRAGAPQPQPVVVRIDLDDTIADATATVGFSLATIESAPWAKLQLAAQTTAPKGARTVVSAPQATKGAPADFWSTVRS